MTRNYQVNWRWRKYWGTSVNATLTEAQIEALANSSLSTTLNGSYSMAAGDYKYFAVPVAFGEPSLIKDSGTGLGVAMADIPEGYTPPRS